MKIITYLILKLDYIAIIKIQYYYLYNSLMANTIKSWYNKYKSSNPQPKIFIYSIYKYIYGWIIV